MRRFSALFLGLYLLVSCSSMPPGIESRLLRDGGLPQRIFWQGDLSAPCVHVYLEGDGRPWIREREIAADPGPLDPLALRLMARDPTPALLVGRPCYHGLAHMPGCTPWLWTHGRYSEQVVGILAQAIARALPPQPGRKLVLIGHSGGGTLAVLLAPSLPGVKAVITLAANLDVAAWAEHHGYSPLSGSLNPARLPPLPPNIRQVHLIAERDETVPPETIARYLAHNPQAQIQRIPGTDHRHGWLERWPHLLTTMTNCQAAGDQQ